MNQKQPRPKIANPKQPGYYFKVFSRENRLRKNGGDRLVNIRLHGMIDEYFHTEENEDILEKDEMNNEEEQKDMVEYLKGDTESSYNQSIISNESN